MQPQATVPSLGVTGSRFLEEPLANGRSARSPGITPTFAVIVPATDVPATLPRCLAAARAAMSAGDELLVVTEPTRASPAVARNCGAGSATADVLVFIDADVVVHPDALVRMRQAFAADPGLSAVFGSYDDGPASPKLVSQFRNLLHHHLHHRHPGLAATFWSGLGAIRRADFLRLGGFDTQRFAVPAVEDIDLGMRLWAAGGRIELHPKIQGTHLKQWTLAGMIRTDYTRRGVPWTLLCLERRSLPRTLNLSWREQGSTLATLLAVTGLLTRRARVASGAAAAVGVLNASFYGLLCRRVGVPRAAICLGLHSLHRLVAVAALPSGAAMYARRSLS